MRRPYRRFLYGLSHKLKIDIDVILTWSSDKIAGYMAYGLTQNQDWVKDYRKEQERIQSEQLTPDQYAERFKALLGGGHGNS